MIEELILKNARLKEDNSQAWNIRMPFSDVQIKPNDDAAGFELKAEEPFVLFANLKSIEYISQQFNSHKHTREVLLDTKNACFTDLHSQVEDLVKKLYSLFVKVQSQSMKLKTFEETMISLDEVFTNSANT